MLGNVVPQAVSALLGCTGTICKSRPIIPVVPDLDEQSLCTMVPSVIYCNHGGAYLLQDNTGVTLPDKFSPNQLKLVAPPENSAPDGLPPDEYEIDEILNHKGPANKCKYLVHWKGYSHSENQWISAKDVHAPKLVKRYWDLLKQPPSSSPSSSS